ncbi:S49 family peptidase [Pseudoalteromonas sp. S16_S37]|uniref:S49 family peptidase n=1 Tax=Pseudoalteromonas sp. S16_S37 TaxID=2720228 RepID=UPI00167FEF4B|nr:S49 family peptidase [Pseudoalteromonas sp. S16_S37]MBD1583492.1 S49 family peptidase [Pseudoalteromonas sp. S16_S37]
MSKMTNYPHIAAMVFNTPLLATATLAQTVSEFLHKRLLGDFPELSSTAQVSAKQTQEYVVGDPEQGDKVAVIAVHGILIPRMGFIDASCEEVMSYERLQKQINAALKDDKVQEIALDINSGGGSAQGAFECADFIKQAAQQKPIRAIINMNACSGAYLIACACTEIIISKTAVVGSVGVYLKRLDLTAHYEQNGVKIHTFYRGATKVDFHPDIALSEEERKRIEYDTEATYQMFVEYVSQNRNLSIADVQATEADTYQGQAAIDMGLADRLATPQDAINSIVHSVAQQASNQGMIAHAALLKTI